MGCEVRGRFEVGWSETVARWKRNGVKHYRNSRWIRASVLTARLALLI